MFLSCRVSPIMPLLPPYISTASSPWSSTSPYGILLDLMTHLLRAQVLDLLIDEEDSSRGPGITFGPIVLLQNQIPASASSPNNPLTPR